MSVPMFADRLTALLASVDPEVLAVYLYGSRARGTARHDSDVDLGVLEDVVRNHFDDLLDFVAAIRRSMAG